MPLKVTSFAFPHRALLQGFGKATYLTTRDRTTGRDLEAALFVDSRS